MPFPRRRTAVLAAATTLAVAVGISVPASAADPARRPFGIDPATEKRIDDLMAKMTLAEKIGQLRQGGWATGFDLNQPRSGAIGLVTNPDDPFEIAKVQKAARESRLGIPVLIANNVIHGFRTQFPVPLGMAATFDPDLVERTAEVAGKESAAAGLHWTLAPMVDVSRDPRWGRVVEGPGEDPHLARLLAAAQVRGYLKGGIMASIKHFAGYGAAEGGRDYNSTEIPPNQMRDLYLPPFRAGVEAGAQSVMSAFNAINGTPATAHRGMLTDILKGEWGFDGFVISDWDSVWELINHGHAADPADATRKSLNAGLDVEMAGTMFKETLADEVAAGRVPMARVDDAVRRVLRVKFRMGLFDRPDADPAETAARLFTPEYRALARRAAVESLILLKNDGILPIRKDVRSIAVIGSLADSPQDHMGSWGANGKTEDAVTTLKAIRERAGPGVTVTHAPGCEPGCRGEFAFEAAAATARAADLVVAVLGEPWWLTAEGTSRTRLGLPNRQQELLEAVAAAGKPVVLVVLAGRPMALTWAAAELPAMLYAFSPGTMGGAAIADVLFGDADPAGRLPMTMPRSVGQIPIYYNHLPTGRPATGDHFSSKYIDEEVTPLFPFGYGLSYASYRYDAPRIRQDRLTPDGTLQVEVRVTNTSDRPGRELVQLYVRDLVATKSRPVKELKAFQKLSLAPGETKTVVLEVPVAELGFHLDDGRYVVEPGRFRIFVGRDSDAAASGEFEVVER